MRAITRPTGLSLQDWCDQVALDLDEFGPIGKLMDDDWKSWGLTLLMPLQLGGYGLPSPVGFDDWRVWADRVCGDLA